MRVTTMENSCEEERRFQSAVDGGQGTVGGEKGF